MHHALRAEPYPSVLWVRGSQPRSPPHMSPTAPQPSMPASDPSILLPRVNLIGFLSDCGTLGMVLTPETSLPHGHTSTPLDSGWFGTNIATRCCAQQCSKNWKAVCMANSERSHFSVELWPAWYYVDLFLYLRPDLHFCFTAAHKVLNFCTPIWQVYNIPGDFRYRLAYQQGSPPQTPRYHYLTAFIYGTTL